MYLVTYQFNESAIVTVTVKSIAIGTDTFVVQDRNDVSHSLPSDSLICIVPVRHVRRRASTPKVTPQ